MASPLLYLFSKPPSLLTTFFWQYCPNEILDKHKNKLMWKKNFFMFRRLMTMLRAIFISNTFISDTISSIKRSLKKSKHCKWKTCRVKSIIATKIHTILLKSSAYPFPSINTPLNGSPPPLSPSSMILTPAPINKGDSNYVRRVIIFLNT